jgi:hypothetical protein
MKLTTSTSTEIMNTWSYISIYQYIFIVSRLIKRRERLFLFLSRLFSDALSIQSL